MEKLAQRNSALVIDALVGRLAFERTGVQLYDNVISKIEHVGEPRYRALLEVLHKHRGEELEHYQWLESVVTGLGGDPQQTTMMAALEIEECQGIKSVIVDGHNQVLHLLHALLAAELADNAGWDLLVKLADEAGDRKAKVAFTKRLAEEVKHLAFIREAVVTAAEIEILGSDKQLPSRVGEVMTSRPVAAVSLGLIGAAAIGAAAVGIGISARRRASAGIWRRAIQFAS